MAGANYYLVKPIDQREAGGIRRLAVRCAAMNEFLTQFLIESRELVEQATEGLLVLEQSPARRGAARLGVPRIPHAQRWRGHRRVRRHGTARFTRPRKS